MNQRLEVRRQRKTLKESGDYLGVQGINPRTGQLDVLTPSGSSEDRSDPSSRTREKFRSVSERMYLAKTRHEREMDYLFEEIRGFLSHKEQERISKASLKKERVKEEQKSVQWRKSARQWSSIQEPNPNSTQNFIQTNGATLFFPIQTFFFFLAR